MKIFHSFLVIVVAIFIGKNWVMAEIELDDKSIIAYRSFIIKDNDDRCTLAAFINKCEKSHKFVERVKTFKDFLVQRADNEHPLWEQFRNKLMEALITIYERFIAETLSRTQQSKSENINVIVSVIELYDEEYSFSKLSLREGLSTSLEIAHTLTIKRVSERADINPYAQSVEAAIRTKMDEFTSETKMMLITDSLKSLYQRYVDQVKTGENINLPKPTKKFDTTRSRDPIPAERIPADQNAYLEFLYKADEQKAFILGALKLCLQMEESDIQMKNMRTEIEEDYLKENKLLSHADTTTIETTIKNLQAHAKETTPYTVYVQPILDHTLKYLWDDTFIPQVSTYSQYASKLVGGP